MSGSEEDSEMLKSALKVGMTRRSANDQGMWKTGLLLNGTSVCKKAGESCSWVGTPNHPGKEAGETREKFERQ